MYLFNLQNYAFIFTLPNFLLTFCWISTKKFQIPTSCHFNVSFFSIHHPFAFCRSTSPAFCLGSKYGYVFCVFWCRYRNDSSPWLWCHEAPVPPGWQVPERNGRRYGKRQSWRHGRRHVPAKPWNCQEDVLAKGMARTARSSPRCKSPTSSTSSVSPNPVPPHLKMSQQKENKDIKSFGNLLFTEESSLYEEFLLHVSTIHRNWSASCWPIGKGCQFASTWNKK